MGNGQHLFYDGTSEQKADAISQRKAPPHLAGVSGGLV